MASSEPRLVVTQDELLSLCAGWHETPVLGLDTEFVRTRTFYAGLGLIQVCDGREVYLLDTVALENLGAFRDLLLQRRAVIVVHSCSEDMGIFAHELGALPRRIFDTQIAAAFVGLGFSRSYQVLVATVLDVHLAKDQTRSDWLARPLSESQLRYAAADVDYLSDLHERLRAELSERGRLAWVEEEFERLLDMSRYSVAPELSYRRIKGAGQLDRRGLGILRELSTWREHEAIRRDLARNFVVHDKVLLEIARLRPRKVDDLRATKELERRQRRRHGDRLVAIVREAEELAEDSLPPLSPRRPRIPRYKERMRALQEKVAEVAQHMELAPEILAQRRMLESLLHGFAEESSDELPSGLRGWRAEVIGRPLLELLRSD